jgi:Sulfotransferase family
MRALGGPRRGPERDPAPFVVGVGRSGTTLLRLMLDAHPALAIPPETHFLPELVARARSRAGVRELVDEIIAARNWSDFELDAGELHRRAGELADVEPASVMRCFYSLYAERHGKPRWGDKTPSYVKRMRLIADLLDEARFIHLLRDGRDVAISRRRRGMGEGKPISDAAQRWRRRILRAREQAKRLRGRYLELRYEDLVTDPEPTLRAICELIDLDYDPAMLDYHQASGERLREMARDLPAAGGRRARSGEERMAAHALATAPPDPKRLAAWRTEMSAADQAEFEAVAGDLLTELGYESSASA